MALPNVVGLTIPAAFASLTASGYTNLSFLDAQRRRLDAGSYGPDTPSPPPARSSLVVILSAVTGGGQDPIQNVPEVPMNLGVFMTEITGSAYSSYGYDLNFLDASGHGPQVVDVQEPIDPITATNKQITLTIGT